MEIEDVSAIMPSTIIRASNLPTPKISIKMSTIALLTHPRMMQLMGIARYNARKPRKKAAGRPA